MKILFIASEVEGLVKTGGLADVAYALPKALIAAGHDVKVVMPAYSAIASTWQHWQPESFTTKISYLAQEAVVGYQGKHDGISVIAIGHEAFQRSGIYDDGHYSYDDNAYRYAILSKASLDWCLRQQWQPDIVHGNDWQAGLAIFYLAEHFKHDSFFEKTRSVLSIHNGAYQMQCASHWLDSIGIHPRFFQHHDFEDFGNINILKGSLGFADGVTTVSPGYATELTTPLGGHGLDFKYRELTRPILGILNGCDYDHWNPETDPWLPKNYASPDDEGKSECKMALQQEVGLPEKSHVPLLASICRLVEQKGVQLLIPVLMQLLKEEDFQFVLLGSGDPTLSGQLEYLAKQYPEKMRFINGYDVALSHKIEAGADAFMMPSIFEPCGLNQIYSLRYGTVPLVREVGGLQDTVTRLSQSERNLKTATGFMFDEISAEALLTETTRMLNVFRHKPERWKAIQRNGMAKRFNWTKSAGEYVRFYRSLLDKKKTQHSLL